MKEKDVFLPGGLCLKSLHDTLVVVDFVPIFQTVLCSSVLVGCSFVFNKSPKITSIKYNYSILLGIIINYNVEYRTLTELRQRLAISDNNNISPSVRN